MGVIKKIQNRLAQKSKQKAENERYILYVCQETGWSYEESKS